MKQVKVDQLPDCYFHDREYQGKVKVPARYDGRTRLGIWAFMCENCFQEHGVGLGMGMGQKLIVRKKK